MRLPVTARIALLSIALALASSAVVAVIVWQQARAAALDAVERDTVEQADALIGAYRSGGSAALVSAVKDASDTGDATLIAMIADARGRREAGIGPDTIAAPLAPVRFRLGEVGVGAAWTDKPTGYTLRRVGDRWLLIARTLALVNRQQAALERALGIASIVAVVLGIAGGLVVARYVARRLALVTAVLAAAGAGDLSRRVELEGRGDDAFDRLARRLNATLDQLDQLMSELRVVTDGLAHDLRSPLARLRAKTEAAVLAEAPARDAALSTLLAEADLLMQMLSTAIEISRAGQVSRDRFAAIAPRVLLEEVAELYAPVLEEAGRPLALAVAAEAQPIALHRELLSQALTNLIDNAQKYGRGTVTLRLDETAAGVVLSVEDRGPGIAAADRAAALRRFGRLDAARSIPGAGLGMALVDAVARMHGGWLHLDDMSPGLAARIVLPR